MRHKRKQLKKKLSEWNGCGMKKKKCVQEGAQVFVGVSDANRVPKLIDASRLILKMLSDNSISAFSYFLRAPTCPFFFFSLTRHSWNFIHGNFFFLFLSLQNVPCSPRLRSTPVRESNRCKKGE